MPSSLIAIVDDDAMLRAALSSLLRSYGYAVEVFASGEALLAVAGARFACIVSDVRMPGMSGLELRRALLRDDIGTPVILMTAYLNPDVIRCADLLGVRAMLEKPIDSGLLAATIESALAAFMTTIALASGVPGGPDAAETIPIARMRHDVERSQ